MTNSVAHVLNMELSETNCELQPTVNISEVLLSNGMENNCYREIFLHYSTFFGDEG